MAENTDKTPLESNSDTIAEIMTLAENLPDASGGTDISLGLTNTSVDQIIKVKSIDADGRPTEWKATTDSTPLIVEFTMGVSANEPLFSSNYSFDQISAAVNAGRYVVGYSSYISISGDPGHDRYGIYFDLMSTQDVAVFQFFDPYYNYYIKVYVSSFETTAVGMFVKAESNHYGGIKADSAEEADTQPVRIGDDGKLYTKNVDIVTPTAESTDTQAASAKAVWDMLGGGSSGTDISLGVTGASVGDIIKVKQVDADGKPTAWDSYSDQYELLRTITITESTNAVSITQDENGNTFSLSDVFI